MEKGKKEERERTAQIRRKSQSEVELVSAH